MEHQLPPSPLWFAIVIFMNQYWEKLHWTFGMDICAKSSKARETQHLVEILKVELANSV